MLDALYSAATLLLMIGIGLWLTSLARRYAKTPNHLLSSNAHMMAFRSMQQHGLSHEEFVRVKRIIGYREMNSETETR